MQKYQDALRASIRGQLEVWFDSSQSAVSHKELYRFLHTVRGTSGTIGMAELSSTAGGLMHQLNEDAETIMPAGELRRFLFPLASALQEFGTETAAAVAPGEQPDNAVGVDGLQGVILALDEDPAALVSLKDELARRGYQVLAATAPERAFALLHQYEPDCLIFDLHTGDDSGLDLILSLREKLRRLFLPTTVLSADDRKASRIQAYRLGADDCLAKPPDMPELLAVLERQLVRKRLFDRLVTVDPLTGALRRSEAEPILRQLAEHAAGAPATIALLDVDRLRLVNKAHGPAEGDRLLQAAVEHLRTLIQPECRIIRLGGGTFLLLYPGVPEAVVHEELDLAQSDFKSIVFETDEGEMQASWSFGTAALKADDLGGRTTTVEQVVAAAFAALRAAKPPADALRTPGLAVAIVEEDAVARTMLAESVSAAVQPYAACDVRMYRDGASFVAAVEDAGSGGASLFVVLGSAAGAVKGPELVKRLRALPGGDRHAVLTMTGREAGQDAVQALLAGADDYVPFAAGVRGLEAQARWLAGRWASLNLNR